MATTSIISTPTICAVMDASRILYTVHAYKGHVYRVGADGRITSASSADKAAAQMAATRKD
jgi:hypothetical protein